MKLYHFPPSPNSRRVLAVAYHLGIEIELENIALPKGEQMAREFVNLNPNHKIPTLIDDDFVLWESTAIMQYLVSKIPDTTLWSDKPKVQADINRWLCWNIAHWSPACGIFVYEYLVKQFLNRGDPNPEELEKGKEQFHLFAKVLDDYIRDRQWLVGDDVTLADYAVGSFIDLAEPAHIPVDDYAGIVSWYSNIEGLDAWKKSAPENFTY